MNSPVPELLVDQSTVPASNDRLVRPTTIRDARVYRVLWRWHFYAGVLTSPILFVVTLTGLLYIFAPEIEQAIHRDRLFVQPGSDRLAPSAIVETAAQSHPGWQVSRMLIEPADDRSVIISLSNKEIDQQRNIYIDPYRGTVLADVNPEQDRVSLFFQTVLELHRTLFLGTTGRILVEFATCWSILLMLTGIYLWWPRRWNVSRGVWIPRLRAKPYTVQRDLHTIAGIYTLPVLLVIALTGMFYTIAWGKGAVALSIISHEGISGLSDVGSGPVGQEDETADSPLPSRAIDRVVHLARDAYPERSLGLNIADATATNLTVLTLDAYAVNSRGPFESTTITFNPTSGAIIKQTSLAEDSAFWWHQWVYPLHVGSVWGLPTKILWAIGCVVLLGLPITGLWMWWLRRPKARSGLPRRPSVRLPYWLVGLVGAACVFFPVAGASVLVFVGSEWCWNRLQKKTRKTAPPR